AAPPPDVQRLAVLGNLEAIGAGGLAARYLLPLRIGVPLPQLAVVFTGHHAASSSSVHAARGEVRGDESTVRKTDHRIQADRIWSDGASDPRQCRWRRSGVELEDLD